MSNDDRAVGALEAAGLCHCHRQPVPHVRSTGRDCPNRVDDRASGQLVETDELAPSDPWMPLLTDEYGIADLMNGENDA